MHILINHVGCNESNWGGDYSCRHWLIMSRIPEGKTYHDSPSEDWVNLIKQHQFLNEMELKFYKQRYPDHSDDLARSRCMRETNGIKPEVVEWLNANVLDREDSESPKGWACPVDYYNANNPINFSIFFHRESDALKFIERWSQFKKPTSIFNYFKDIRKKLNLETNELEVVKEL